MNLFVTAIASGSNGNCYYIGDSKDAVLIDAGISCREIEQRMKRLELSIKKVRALFISHEHTDHIKGVRVLAKKYNLPVYITHKTLLNARIDLGNPNIIRLVTNEVVKIGNLGIKAFSKLHDASDPQSFIIRNNEICIGVLTDIGEACQEVISHFSMCHAVFLETNYDDEMLENGRYPFFLKQRVKSRWGHLSNIQALDLMLEHGADFLSHVFLSHISKDNNHPDLLLGLFKENSKGPEIILTSRNSEIPVFEISNTAKPMKKPLGKQQSLF